MDSGKVVAIASLQQAVRLPGKKMGEPYGSDLRKL